MFCKVFFYTFKVQYLDKAQAKSPRLSFGVTLSHHIALPEMTFMQNKVFVQELGLFKQPFQNKLIVNMSSLLEVQYTLDTI